MLGTLFASTGTIMLTAGDEFGRSQRGNNNAYAQDNGISWIDWSVRDRSLEDHVAHLAAFRADHASAFRQFPSSGDWLTADQNPMSASDWEQPSAGYLCHVSETYGFSIDRATRQVSIFTNRKRLTGTM